MSAPPNINPLDPNSEFFSDVLLLFSRTNPPRILYLAEEVDLPVEDYVKTARFDQECSAKAHVHASSLDESSNSSDNESIWSSSTSESTATTVETDPHEP